MKRSRASHHRDSLRTLKPRNLHEIYSQPGRKREQNGVMNLTTCKRKHVFIVRIRGILRPPTQQPYTWQRIGRNHRGVDKTPTRNSHLSARLDTRVETRRDLTEPGSSYAIVMCITFFAAYRS